MEPVIKSVFLRIGDTVIFNETDSSISKTPFGMKGVVTGFNRYIQYVCYSDLYLHSKPGIYSSNGNPIILWENGDTTAELAWNLMFEEDRLRERRSEDTVYQKAFGALHRESDLPVLPYWVGMTVVLTEPYFDQSYKARIQYINWNHVGETCDDGITPYPIYSITPVDVNGPTMFISADKIKSIIEYGNYYHWEHDQTKMTFKTLVDAVKFYKSKGFIKQVRNPKTNQFICSIDEAEEMVNAEIGDYITLSYGLPDTVNLRNVYRIIDQPLLRDLVRTNIGCDVFERS